MAHLCDVCGARPATVRLAVLRNGRRHVIDVCDFHYAQLTRHQRALSPLEALFMGGAPAEPPTPETAAPPDQNAAARLNEAEGANIDRYFSDGAKEMLMRAAERAVQSGCSQVDTEHLLYELANNAVIESILKSVGIDAANIRAYIDANAQRREATQPPADGMIAVSPQMLRGDVAEGAKVRCRYDANEKRLAFDITRAGLANRPGEGTPATP